MSEFGQGYDDQMAWLQQQPEPVAAAAVALPNRLSSLADLPYNRGGNAACRVLMEPARDRDNPTVSR